MSKRIYVGNLPFSVTEDKLREMFKSFGRVEAVDVTEGSAVVVMADGADEAIRSLNDRTIDGAQVFVKEADLDP